MKTGLQKLTIAMCGLLVLGGLLAQGQPSTINMGVTNVLPNYDDQNADLLFSQYAVLPQVATLQTISFYVTNATGNLYLGLYDTNGDNIAVNLGGPGNLLATTVELTPTNGWNTASVTTPVALPAGIYWLTFLASDPLFAGLKGPAAPLPNSPYNSVTYGPMPSVFGTLQGTSSGNHRSMYATLAVSLDALQYVAEPASAVSMGTTLNDVRVKALSGGSPVPGAALTVYLTNATWTGSPGTLTGTLTRLTDASGIADFNDLSINLPAGSIQLAVTAVATELVTNSTSFSVTPPPAPAVTIISPADNSIYAAPATFTLAATVLAAHAVTNLQFFQGASVIGAFTSSPASMTVANLSPGNYSYTAIAQDDFGSRGTSSVVQVAILGTNWFPVGVTSVLSTPMATNSGTVFCEFTTVPGDALIENLSVYVTNTDGSPMLMGIYDGSGGNGRPGALVAATAELTPTNGWNTASVTNAAPLPAGIYWLACEVNSDTLALEAAPAAPLPQSPFIFTSAYGPMPDAFVSIWTPGLLADGYLPNRWSMFATFSNLPPRATNYDITIGVTNIGPVFDNGNAQGVFCEYAPLPQAATIESLSFYVTNAAGTLVMGIYDSTGADGGPGALLAATDYITPTTGWNTASVTNPAALPAGIYWLSYLASDNDLGFQKEPALPFPNSQYNFSGYTALPATFAPANSSVNHWCLYATLTVFPPPPPQAPLTVTRAGANVVISWPAIFTNAVLQSSPGLSVPAWAKDPAPVVAVGTNDTVTVAATNSARFYRLHP
ncbi:MAG: Ig-like domain-containing protein [Verrucomicrobiota bacterium]